MSEPAAKQRLRRRVRIITTTLEAQGYRVRTFETGPFHLQARKGKTARDIRICFGYTDEDEVRAVSHEPGPDRCCREIWQVSEDGRSWVVTKVSKFVNDK